MSQLFASPGKSAQQAGEVQQGITNQEIGQLEQYTGQQEGQLRAAIKGIPSSPYNDVAFGNQGPGTVFGSGSITPDPKNPFAAGPPKPPPPQQGYGGGGGGLRNPNQPPPNNPPGPRGPQPQYAPPPPPPTGGR